MLSGLLAAFKTDACVTVTGNGLLTYPGIMPVVSQAFSTTEEVDSGVPLAESIGQVGLQKWQGGERLKKIEPLYLKALVYQVKPPRGTK